VAARRLHTRQRRHPRRTRLTPPRSPGANRTDEPRPALLVNYCPPWVRPFSNHLLELDPQKPLLDLLGCRRWFIYGHTELAHLAHVASTDR